MRVALNTIEAPEHLADGVTQLPPPYDLALVGPLKGRALEDRVELMARYPGLTSARVLRRLYEEADASPRRVRKDLTSVVGDLMLLAGALDRDRDRFPRGKGPIEVIARDLLAGIVGEAEAARRAQDPVVKVAMTPLYTGTLTALAEDVARSGDWRRGLALGRLALAATAAAGVVGERGTAKHQTEENFLIIALAVLIQALDGRLLREAQAVGDRLLAAAESVDDRVTIGRAAYRLGGLFLDPLKAIATASPEALEAGNIALFWDRWREMMFALFGDDLRLGDEAQFAPPHPHEMIRTAVAYYRRAIPARDGDEKGMAAKALLEALSWQARCGEEIDRDEFASLGKLALSFLDPASSPQHILAVRALLGETVTARDTSALTLAELIEERGLDKALELVRLEAQSLRQSSPHRALERLAEADGVLRAMDREDVREEASRATIYVLAELAPPDLPRRATARELRKLQARSRREGWNALQTAAALVSVAAASTTTDTEDVGVDFLAAAMNVGDGVLEPHLDAVALLAGTLRAGAASNAFHRGDLDEAVRWYGAALSVYLSRAMPNRAHELTRRIGDVMQRAPDALAGRVARETVRAVVPHVLELERQIGESLHADLTALLKDAAAAAFASGESGSAVFDVAQQAVKGAAFAAMLGVEPLDAISRSPDVRELAETVAWVEATSSLADQARGVTAADVELDGQLLTAYSSRREAKQGATEGELLENRQRHADRLLTRALLSAAPHEARLLDPAVVQSRLGGRTTILDLMLGRDRQGTLCVYVTALDHRDAYRTAISWPGFSDGDVVGTDGTRLVIGHPLARMVTDVRDQLTSDPGFEGTVRRETAELLEAHLDGFLGSAIVAVLEESLSNGRDHLCIVPHGPLHYYPFHLLGRQNATLAERFVVTYLPNVQILVHGRGTGRAETRAPTVAALGMTFEGSNRFGLPLLPQSRSEVRAVADLFGVDPLIDDDATEASVAMALTESTIVHLSTHGTHNVAAPAFQTLYFTPDGTSDGRLTAQEIVRLDLRGLDLITLSACETALGRFDRCDNFRGLPASLILAGASTIVGTLWPASDAAAEEFFVSFYRDLRDGAGKLDAFATAQRRTRARFPNYIDWAPFYYIGAW